MLQRNRDCDADRSGAVPTSARADTSVCVPPVLQTCVNHHVARCAFTTVNDVVAYLIELEPGFDELDHETLRDIVRSRTLTRYADIGPDELDAMYEAAMLHLSAAHDEG